MSRDGARREAVAHFPVLTHAASIAEIDKLGLKPEVRKSLMHDTAAKVFTLD